jgi:hypothetical protein
MSAKRLYSGTGRDADDVGLAPVADDAGLAEPGEHLAPRGAIPQPQRQLAAAACRIARCQDLDLRSASSSRQPLEQPVSASDLARKRSMPASHEELQRRQQRRHAEHRRVRQLPALGAGDGHEVRLHAEACRLVVAPPAGEAGQAVVLAVARVDEGARRPRRDRRSGTCSCTRRRSRPPSRAAPAARCRWRAPGPSRPARRRHAPRPSAVRCRAPRPRGTARPATAPARASRRPREWPRRCPRRAGVLARARPTSISASAGSRPWKRSCDTAA